MNTDQMTISERMSAVASHPRTITRKLIAANKARAKLPRPGAIGKKKPRKSAV